MNINLKSFYDISHNRTYNQGAVYIHKGLFGGASLYRANHHHYLPNLTTLTPAQNREVRMAFAAALAQGIAPHLMAEIRARLGLQGAQNAAVAAQPLERREIKAIFDMLEARKAFQLNFLPKDGQPPRIRQMLDGAISHFVGIPPPPRLGNPVFDHVMRNLAISRFYDSTLKEMSRNPGMVLEESDLRQKVFEEYDQVWQDFHGALSECEPKDVYRHLAILGLKDDPDTKPAELRHALSLLDKLAAMIPDLAKKSDAEAAKAIYEKMCELRGERPNPKFSTLTQTREIRRFLAADKLDAGRENLRWIDDNWTGGAGLETRVGNAFAQAGFDGDRLGALTGEFRTRLQGCLDKLADMDDNERDAFVAECISKSVEKVRADVEKALNADRNVDAVRNDHGLRQQTKDALVGSIKMYHAQKLPGFAAAVIDLSRLDFSAELNAFLNAENGFQKDDIRNLALAMGRKLSESIKTRYPELDEHTDAVTGCVMTVLVRENADLQLAISCMSKSDLDEFAGMMVFKDPSGADSEELNTRYYEVEREINAVVTSDERMAELETQRLGLKERVDTLNIAAIIAQDFGHQLDNIRQLDELQLQMLERNPAAARLVDDVADQLFDILRNGNGNGTQQSEFAKQSVRNHLGGTHEDIRNEVRHRFFKSPKLVRMVRNLTRKDLDPALVETFKENMSSGLRYDDDRRLFRSGGPVDEFFRVRSKGSMFDVITIGGRPVPAMPVNPQRIRSVIPAEMITIINAWTKDGDPNVEEAKCNRCLAFVEAVYDGVGQDMGRVIAVCSILGLNGAQMGFNIANQEHALKAGEVPASEFISELADTEIAFDVTGSPNPPTVPAEVSFDRATGHIRVSVVVERGFSVISVNGTNVSKGSGATAEKVGMVEAFRVGIELGDTVGEVEVPAQGGSDPRRFNVPRIEVTSIEKA